MCKERRYDRVERLVGRAHIALFWLCVALAVALYWRPLGTLDFVRVHDFHFDASWTAPTGAAKGEYLP